MVESAIVEIPEQEGDEKDEQETTQESEVVGFIRSEDVPNQWLACDDFDTVMQTPRSRCVLAKTRQDAVAALCKRFKTQHRLLERVIITKRTYIPYWKRPAGARERDYQKDNGPAGPNDVITVRHRSAYYGEDLDEVVMLAKQFGKVRCMQLTRSYLRQHYRRRERDQLYEAGCHFNQDEEIVYNPKRAASLRRRHSHKATGRRPASGPVTIDIVADVIRAMRSKLSGEGIRLDDTATRYRSYYSRHLAANALIATASTFNKVFGHCAHRQLPEFQTLKKDWKRRLASTRKNWMYDGRRLCEWMDYEITRRAPKKRDLGRHVRYTDFTNPLKCKDAEAKENTAEAA